MKWAKAFILSYLAIVVGITLSIVPEYDTKAALLTMTAGRNVPCNIASSLSE